MWMVNLLDAVLTSGQEEVLKLGLNIVPVPARLPLMCTLVGVEDGARQLCVIEENTCVAECVTF